MITSYHAIPHLLPRHTFISGWCTPYFLAVDTHSPAAWEKKRVLSSSTQLDQTRKLSCSAILCFNIKSRNEKRPALSSKWNVIPFRSILSRSLSPAETLRESVIGQYFTPIRGRMSWLVDTLRQQRCWQGVSAGSLITFRYGHNLTLKLFF